MCPEDKLRASWSKKEKDIVFHWPGGSNTRSDAHWLYGVLGDEVTAELTRRGYDITTLKFSIEPLAGNQRFTSQRQEGTE